MLSRNGLAPTSRRDAHNLGGGCDNLLGRSREHRARASSFPDAHANDPNQRAPDDGTASSQSGGDFAQMVEISHAKEYYCKEPLLLILGAGQRQRQRTFRVFVCPAERAPSELLPLLDAASDSEADGGRSIC
jgi:hypothetical protein